MAHNWHMGGNGVQNALASLPHFSRLSDQKTTFFKSSAISFTPLFICRPEPDPQGPSEPLTLLRSLTLVELLLCAAYKEDTHTKGNSC